MPPRSIPRGLYAIADTTYLDETRLAFAVEQALLGGARTLQYRDKSTVASRRLRQAEVLRALCDLHGACFLINDDVELARVIKADGVHVGRDDAGIDLAREHLGANAIIGVSCYNDMTRAKQAVRRGANYVAFGSFFPSRTKPNAVRADVSLLHRAHHEIPIPVVAIGGITPDNGGELIAAGAQALAVISGVFDCAEVKDAARRYASLFEQPIQRNIS